MRDVFSQFGPIEELILMRDAADGTSKGSAFIKYKTKEQAIVAMRFVNGNVYMGGSDKPLEVRFAENKKKVPTTTHTPANEQQNPARSMYPTQSMAPVAPVTQASVRDFLKF